MPGMGCLPLGWGSIHLDEVFVPSSHLIGQPGRGFRAVMSHFDFSRAALGLLCLGAAQASLDEAAVYATQRHAFGKPIGDNQGVSFAPRGGTRRTSKRPAGCAIARCGLREQGQAAYLTRINEQVVAAYDRERCDRSRDENPR